MVIARAVWARSTSSASGSRSTWIIPTACRRHRLIGRIKSRSLVIADPRGGMKLRHRIVLVLSAVLCLLFLLGESPPGQAFLLGKPRPSETHWDADDGHMGAGLAPLVYCLVPGVALLVYGLGDVVLCWVSRRRSN